ncbi:MAG: hypothetical protein M1830_003907 [Pleopsidium flavum]|nr:MAG: hypothetical protein M1830_003907 [Pleopsidium flavum]
MAPSALFASFANFEPDPTALLTEEFSRLAVARHWQPGSKKYRTNQRRCFIEEFQTHWGTDTSSLEIWQALSAEVGITPAPSSITQCKKALSKAHVNIVDLIDCRRAGTAVHRFPSERALRAYTQEMNKFFPKEAAKRDGFLKVLLRGIF